MANSSAYETSPITVGICVLVTSLLLTNVTTASCPTGRMYLGNVNLSHIGQVGSNGVYTAQVGQVHADRPVYKHTHRHLFIYFTRTDMGTYWVVSRNVTANLSDVTIRMSSTSSQPTSTVDSRWQLKQSGVWTTIQTLRTICVNKDFGPCTSGKINVSGLPLTSRRQGRFMGSYSLYNISQSLRPVYMKDDGQEVLFYRHNLWVFSPDINSNSLGMFTKDSAFLPEFILEKWAYLSRFGLQSKRLKIKCIGDANVESYAAASHRGNGCSLAQSASTELQAEPQAPTTLQLTQDLFSNSSSRPVPVRIPQSDLPETDKSLSQEALQQAAPGCQQDVSRCENGEIIETGPGSSHHLVCKCHEGYYGLRCEKEIRCGAAPIVAMATLKEVVEEGLMVMAVYACDVGYHSDVGHVAVCGMDSTWQYLPECRSGLYSGYDWSEISP